ncbi:KR domain-containing protein, partial [Nonomuraea sp. NPDC050643]|uniref:SpnB-like Rossmann fold domain-containing protein n=1 Tax=Nonomuraea sp. NPDC050643 TaxID=3155660 RepID=UPI0033E4CF1E
TWTNIHIHTTHPQHPTTLHTTTTHNEQADGLNMSLNIAGPDGIPLLTIDSLTLRPLPADHLTTTPHHNTLFHLNWVPSTTTSTQSPGATTGWAVLGISDTDQSGLHTTLANHLGIPSHSALTHQNTLLLPLTTTGSGDNDADTPADQAAALTTALLSLLQSWLAYDTGIEEAEQDFDPDTRLVVLTRGAVATHRGEDITDLPASAAWGMLRTAQAEHPDRLLIVDMDDHIDSFTGLADAITAAIATGETQIAVRQGTMLAPRLARTTATTPSSGAQTSDSNVANALGENGFRDGTAGTSALGEPDAVTQGNLAHNGPFDPSGTVLITGGTGTLGAALAHHLTTHHGARHLILASRQGPHHPNATQLHQTLTQTINTNTNTNAKTGTGTEDTVTSQGSVTITVCDLSDEQQLTQLLDSIPQDRPLTAVFHTAAV